MSRETALSRVEEETREIGPVQEMVVEEVVGTGGSLQEVGTLTLEVGTIKEDPGLVVEAVGDLRGINQ